MVWLEFLILIALGPQDDPASQVRHWIEKLGSESVPERDRAMRELKKLGPAARSELQKAAKGSDPEVAERARQTLRVIEMIERLPAELLQAAPGIEDRLAHGGFEPWRRELLELKDEDLSRDSLAFLASGVLEEARTAAEKCGILELIARLEFRRLAPQVAKLLKDSEPKIRGLATDGLRKLYAREEAPGIVKLLEDPDADVRGSAAFALVDLGAKEIVPQLGPLLGHANDRVRANAAWVLGGLGAIETSREILKLLKDPAGNVRAAAVGALVDMDAKQTASEFLALLGDPEVAVRSAAAWALGAMGIRDAAPEISKLLKDPHSRVRYEAVGALGRLGAKASVPEIVLMLKDQEETVRTNAARSLCVLGSTEGAAALPDEDAFYWNAVRRPDLWRRLASFTWEPYLRRSRSDLLETVAEIAGLSVEWDEEHNGSWPSEAVHLSGRDTMMETLPRILGNDYEPVLEEKDRIRIMPRDKALKFWKEWWREEKKK
jgi:HEAT repeat protein